MLEAGHDYVIRCVIPGHRDAGEMAVIHVTDSAGRPDHGTAPRPGSRAAGRVDGPRPRPRLRSRSLRAMRSSSTSPPPIAHRGERGVPIPVYGEDLTTLIGHLHLDRGFVPLGV